MDAIYNYLLPAYMPKTNVRSNVHKKSELKEHYNNIINMTKRSPLYIVRLSDDKQAFALNIKESAMNLQSLAKDLTEEEHGYFKKQSVFSEKEDVITAKMLEGKEDSVPNPFSIKVKSLARPQINSGNSYYAMGRGLPAGDYPFRVKVEDNMYEFPFQIEEGMTNLDIGTKFVNFINQADIGLQANLTWGERNEKMQIELQSYKTGDAERLIFELSDVESTYGRQGLVEYYGLDRFTQTPKSAIFDMNGEETRALSNRFILNGSLEVQLIGLSKEEVQIGYKNDAGEALGKVKEVLGVWNQLMDKATEYAENSKSYPKLVNELKAIMKEHQAELETSGVIIGEDGNMSLDEALAIQAFDEGDLEELFTKDSGFVRKIKEKMNKVSTDPMEYVDKKMVTYPNLKKQGFSFTYMTSMYSGMLFNYYC